MPICWHCWNTAGCSSIFILTSLALPLAAFTTFSSTGVSCLQGPHHGAQKSTSTGAALRFLDHVLDEGLGGGVRDQRDRGGRGTCRLADILKHTLEFRLNPDGAGWPPQNRPIKWRNAAPNCNPQGYRAGAAETGPDQGRMPGRARRI